MEMSTESHSPAVLFLYAERAVSYTHLERRYQERIKQMQRDHHAEVTRLESVIAHQAEQVKEMAVYLSLIHILPPGCPFPLTRSFAAASPSATTRWTPAAG